MELWLLAGGKGRWFSWDPRSKPRICYHSRVVGSEKASVHELGDGRMEADALFEFPSREWGLTVGRVPVEVVVADGSPTHPRGTSVCCTCTLLVLHKPNSLIWLVDCQKARTPKLVPPPNLQAKRLLVYKLGPVNSAGDDYWCPRFFAIRMPG